MKKDPRSCERNLEASKKKSGLVPGFISNTHLHLSHFLKLFHSQNRRVLYLMLLEWERQLRSLFTKFNRDSMKQIIKYILSLIYTYVE